MFHAIAAAMGRVRVALLILVILLASGTIAYNTIPKEANPEIKIPIIYVSVFQQGIAPGDAERMIIKPLEQELSGLESLDEMRSTAFQGGGNVVLEFDAGFEADEALTEVRESVDDAKPELPADAEEPSVNEVDLSLFPVLNVVISGNVDEKRLLAAAERAQDSIEGITDVLEANIIGDRERMVEVLIDPESMNSYNLAAGEVARQFRGFNQVIAAGNVDTGKASFPVEVPGLIENVEDVLDMPIKSRGDRVVRASDVADVRAGFEDRENKARLNGEEALVLEVVKRSGANVLATVDAVKGRMAALESELPDEVSVTYTQNQAENVKDLLGELESNVITAVVLVLIIVLGVLGWRISLMTAISIPGSFLTGVLVIMALGYTLNNIVLFGLILSVGMLIDGTIIVTEYADRKMTEGIGRRQAFTRAAQLMAWPIIAATLTTLAAFFPLLFWPGTPGEFMKFLPITLIATLSAAAAMALIFVPALGTLIGKPARTDHDPQAQALAADGGDLSIVKGLTGAYIRLLRAGMNRAGTTVAIGFAILAGIFVLYGQLNEGTEFFPDIEPDNASVLVKARGNLGLAEKDELVRQVEERVFGLTGVANVYTRVGEFGRSGSNLPEDTIGQLSLALTDWQTRPPADAILAKIRKRVSELNGIEIETRTQQQGPGQGKPIAVRVVGNDIASLTRTVARIRDHMRDNMSGFEDVEDNRPLPGIQWELALDRAEAQRYGADLGELGEMVRMVTNGATLATFRPDNTDEDVDIRARFPVNERHLDRLDNLRVATANGKVPASYFIERKPQPEVSNIYRVDGERYMEIKADVAPDVQANAKRNELRGWLADQELGEVTWQFVGESEEQQESKQFLMQAFVAAVAIMFAILLTQFNSFYHVLVVLTAVILSVGGVLVGLMVTGRPLGIVMVGTGIVSLTGIVVNNNIVFIDTFNRLKQLESTTFDAILRTGAQRFRPVLLTAGTTMAGLTPMVMMWTIDFGARSFSVGAPSTQIFVQLATAIFSGLGFASIMTLLVTPAMLVLHDNLQQWKAARAHDRAPAGETA